MPSTTTYKREHVIVVKVPFSNHTGIKPRPALVISTGIPSTVTYRTLLFARSAASRVISKEKPVPVVPNVQPLRFVQDVIGKSQFQQFQWFHCFAGF